MSVIFIEAAFCEDPPLHPPFCLIERKNYFFHLFSPKNPTGMSIASDFYLRYYVGHKGKFGHEFLEFEFRPDGKLRYANNSNYKNDTMIRKEAYVHKAVLEELKRIIEDSEVMQEDDNLWPSPDRVGRQELEIVIGKVT